MHFRGVHATTTTTTCGSVTRGGRPVKTDGNVICKTMFCRGLFIDSSLVAMAQRLRIGGMPTKSAGDFESLLIGHQADYLERNGMR